MSNANTVRDDLRRRINAGEFKPGDRLPRFQDLMGTYNLPSKSAIDRAMRDLESEGLITVVHGSGSYVRRRHHVNRDLVAGIRLEHRRAVYGSPGEGGLFEAMTGTDVEVTTTYERTAASARVAEVLGLEPASQVLVRTFRYAVDGAPHQIARSYLPVPTAAVAGLSGPECEQPAMGTMAHLHAAGITVDRALLALETRMPTVDETRDLVIPRGTPVYEHWRTLYRQGAAVEVSTAVVPGHLVSYVFDIDLSAGAW